MLNKMLKRMRSRSTTQEMLRMIQWLIEAQFRVARLEEKNLLDENTRMWISDGIMYAGNLVQHEITKIRRDER